MTEREQAFLLIGQLVHAKSDDEYKAVRKLVVELICQDETWYQELFNEAAEELSQFSEILKEAYKQVKKMKGEK